jgi:type VI secretion system protein ImpE
MSAQDLLQNGHLKEAVAAMLEEVRNHPADRRRRTFLFELLCFSGDYGRASKHLTVLADESADAEIGAVLYRSALSASQTREFLFAEQSGTASAPPASGRRGTLNGTSFQTIEDCDERIGARLEVFIAGECVWLPFEHIGTLRMAPPRLLRDTLWPTAQVTGGPALNERDFGDILLPVLYPFSWQHLNDMVKLGRETVWDDAGRAFGQKLLLLDGEHVVPYLEIRELHFTSSELPATAVPVAKDVDNDS